MSDPLHQLLHNADENSPPPAVDSDRLTERVRYTIAHRRKLRMYGTVACTSLAVGAILISLVPHHRTTSQNAQMAGADTQSIEAIQHDAAYHERVAALLSAHHEAAPPVPSVSDSFLQQLQIERSKAALVMLKMTTNQTDETDSQRLDRLRQMIALFPETSAATEATQRIQQLENSRRPL